jgi:hypothetical protein
MKTRVAITLIVMGTLLLMTPVLSDYLYQRNLVLLMTHAVMLERLGGNMSTLCHIGFWVIGSLMIGIAILASTYVERAPASDGTLEADLPETESEEN